MPGGEGFTCILSALTAAALLASYPAAADEAVTINLTGSRFDCKEALFLPDGGFERCDVYTVPRFTAPSSALLKVFGHCEVTIRYKTRDGLMEKRDELYEKFYGAVVDGAGLAPVKMTFNPPLRLVDDPIVEAKATNLRCSIDQVFSY